MTTNDPVYHPAHYTQGEIECWDAARTFLGDEGFIAALRFQVNKYNWRLGSKDARLRDAAKLANYANKLLEVVTEVDK